MDPSIEVARRFDAILASCSAKGRPDDLHHADRILYYVVAVRCEMDMNGFDSVVDQLLTESELNFFCESLEELNEVGLASAWRKIAQLLDSANHNPSSTRPVSSLPQAVRRELETLAQAANAGDRLWQLDDKLAALSRSP